MKRVSKEIVEAGKEVYCPKCRRHVIVDKAHRFGFVRNHCTRCRKLLSSAKGENYEDEEMKIRKLITDG